MKERNKFDKFYSQENESLTWNFRWPVIYRVISDRDLNLGMFCFSLFLLLFIFTFISRLFSKTVFSVLLSYLFLDWRCLIDIKQWFFFKTYTALLHKSKISYCVCLPTYWFCLLFFLLWFKLCKSIKQMPIKTSNWTPVLFSLCKTKNLELF